MASSVLFRKMERAREMTQGIKFLTLKQEDHSLNTRNYIKAKQAW